MNAIAISTQKVVLGEVIDIRDGTHDTPAYVESGIPLITSKNLSDAGLTFDSASFISEEDHAQISKRSGVQKGDVLYGMIGTIGKPTLVEVDRAFSIKNIALFKQAVGVVDSKYLRWLLDSPDVNAQIARVSKGGTQKFVALGALRCLTVHLPPLEEQRRIAAILDQAETLRTQRRQALAHLDTLTQSLFLDMFGDPVANPKEWVKKPFGTVCETRLGKMLDAKQQTGANSRQYLRNANVQWFHIDTSDLLEMDFDADARETFRLHSGDLLICEGGEPGRAAIWRGELEDVYYQKALHRGRPKSDLVNAEYLVWLLWFLSKRGGLGDHVTAATIAHLTGEKLKAMAIPVPPLTLQKAFATRIQAIKALKATHRTALAQLDALFASLQQRAFAGEL